MAAASDYSTLITSEHVDKPKFVAMVEAVTGAFADIGNAMASMPTDFDLDSAIGAQLDAIGVRVGLSRNVPLPLAVYFSFGVTGLGFGEGSWKGPFDPTEGLTALDDETYRTMLRAKIGANQWDGTIEGWLAIWQQVFAGTGALAFLQDNQDMTMDIYIAGTTPPAVLLAMFKNNYMPTKPEGVQIRETARSSVSGAPLFGFGVQNSYIAGFGSGAWGTPL